MFFPSLILLSISLYFGWRYSKEPADMDFAYLHFEGFIGSWYGRDYVDVKSPVPHLVNWCFVKLGRNSIPATKFIEHTAYALPGLVYYLSTGQFFPALVFTYMINSGWLWAFHGNVSQFPAGMIMLSFAFPQYGWVFWGLAVAYEPKLVIAYIPFAVISGWWWQSALWAVIAVAIVCGLYFFKNQWFLYCKEAMWDLSRKLNAYRKGIYDQWVPYWQATEMVSITPWMILAVVSNPSIIFWITPIVYLFTLASGKAIRGNHLLVLIPFIAVSNINPALVLLLLATDFYSGGFYLRDIWFRFYQVFRNPLHDVMGAGLYLRDKPGTMFAFGMHSQIYIYANKPLMYGCPMQIEIRENSPRYRELPKKFRQNPPDWVVETDLNNMMYFNPNGYALVLKGDTIKVWRHLK